jgi:hypothetical protein
MPSFSPKALSVPRSSFSRSWQDLAVAQQHAQLLAGQRLDVDRAVPAGAHDLRDRLGVLAVALDRHRPGHRSQPTRLDADRGPAALLEPGIEPARERPGFQAEPSDADPGLAQPGIDRFDLARDLRLANRAARLVQDGDRRLFQ